MNGENKEKKHYFSFRCLYVWCGSVLNVSCYVVLFSQIDVCDDDDILYAKVPDPRFPFLGVHFTPRMDGSVWLGPNAILAFKREGYTWKDFDMKDFIDSIRYKGFQKLAIKFAGFGAGEMIRSVFIQLQLKELRKFIPHITAGDIQR